MKAHETTIISPLGVLDCATDAELARRWLGMSIVDEALGQMMAGRHSGPLAKVLADRNLINETQQTQMGMLPFVQVIGTFEILSRLGQGAMGDIWLARQVGSDRRAALKTITPRLEDGADFIQRFLRECDVLSTLHHPYIASAIARGTHNNQPFLAMELIHGPSLADLLQEQDTLPEYDVLRVAYEVAQGLEYAYSTARLVHRDIKPGNILLDRSGRKSDGSDRTFALMDADQVKIIDFGLAKSMAPADMVTSMTLAGMVMGTPSYISPEQINGQRDLDHRTDQYGLGATLYHVLTGQPPFNGPSSNVVVSQHLTAPVPDPRTLNPRLSARTSALVMTALAKSRQHRFQSWAAFCTACDQALQDLAPERVDTTRQHRRATQQQPKYRRQPSSVFSMLEAEMTDSKSSDPNLISPNPTPTKQPTSSAIRAKLPPQSPATEQTNRPVVKPKIAPGLPTPAAIANLPKGPRLAPGLPPPAVDSFPPPREFEPQPDGASAQVPTEPISTRYTRPKPGSSTEKNPTQKAPSSSGFLVEPPRQASTAVSPDRRAAPSTVPAPLSVPTPPSAAGAHQRQSGTHSTSISIKPPTSSERNRRVESHTNITLPKSESPATKTAAFDTNIDPEGRNPLWWRAGVIVAVGSALFAAFIFLQ